MRCSTFDRDSRGGGHPGRCRRKGVAAWALAVWQPQVRPKGESVRQLAIGTFDNFNLVVAGAKGTMAAGVDLTYDTLVVPALDEVSATYGLLAESVSHPDDFSSVTYRLRPQAKFVRRRRQVTRDRTESSTLPRTNNRSAANEKSA